MRKLTIEVVLHSDSSLSTSLRHCLMLFRRPACDTAAVMISEISAVQYIAHEGLRVRLHPLLMIGRSFAYKSPLSQLHFAHSM